MNNFVSPEFRINLPPTPNYRKELKSILIQVPHLNSITFGYNGEPTLNNNLLDFLEIASEVRDKLNWTVEKPILTLFTNSSTLYIDEIRHRVKQFEFVLAKLDIAQDEDFIRTNRPHKNCPNIDVIIESLIKLRNEIPNSCKLAVQSLLYNSYRDDFIPNINPPNLDKLAYALKRIKPDIVQIYSTARIPAEYFVYAISDDKKQEVVKYLKDIIQDDKVNIHFY
jgi:wyosine [tRNA(Phe)-imidazoG37] synthetase (radical SAM superfamily)